jgi:small-conductance mechanosensitive channel
MEGRAEVHNLVIDLLADLRNITVLWQIGVLAICLLCAWQVSRILRARILTAQSKAGNAEATVKISVGGFNRLIFPLTALALMYVGRWVLHRFYPVHLLNIAIALLFALALVRIGVYLLRQAFSPSGLMRQWERAIVWTVWVGLALHISGLLPELAALLEELGFQFGKQRISVLTILQGALSVGVTLLLALWAARLVEGSLMRAHRLDPNLRAVFSKLAKTLLIILAVLIALPLVGIDLTVLSVFGGALGVGIGLGLQKIAANYMSGFIILLDRSISLGALVTIDSHYGEVTRLTARYIVVKGLDGTEALIPNESVVSSTVINHSYSDRRVRVDVPVQVSYQSDVELALRLMLDAANRHARVIQDPKPAAILKDFADSGINLEMFVWIADPENGKGNLRSELNLDIWKAFQANRIDIPFPQRDVRIVSAPTPQTAV